MTDPSQPNQTRKLSIYDEEIVVKPSTELIQDEYEHISHDTVLFHIFRSTSDEDLANNLLRTLQEIHHKLTADVNVHDLNEEKPLEKDLESIKKQSVNKSALILIFIGFFKKDGSLLMKDANGSSKNVSIKTIWNKFSANNCLGLENKPKMFLFCTSRPPLLSRLGVQADSVSRAMHFDKVYDFPAESDILIVYKKIDDTSPIIKKEFFDQLCDNIRNYSKKFDIIDLISYMQNDDSKSIPVIISTLTRKFYLSPSNEREHYLSVVENNTNLDNGLKTIQENLQKLHDIQKKKKEKKFSFNFRRKTEDKPKVVKKEATIEEKPKNPKKLEPQFSRSSNASASTSGRRSRQQSESDFDGKQTSVIDKKKPLWKF